MKKISTKLTKGSNKFMNDEKRNNSVIKREIGDFLLECEVKNLRPRTIKQYNSALMLFDTWLIFDTNIIEVEDIDNRTIKRYIMYLKKCGKYERVSNPNMVEINCPSQRTDYGEGLSVASINSYIRSLRVFFNFLYDNAYIDVNPMEKIKLLKAEQKEKVEVTSEELILLLNSYGEEYTHKRDKTIITLLLDTGARISETLNIQEEDVDLRACTILLRSNNTKTRKDRYIFFSRSTAKVLREWIRYKNKTIDSSL